MGNWDIQPSGVQAVLAQTETTAGDFETQFAALDAALRGAATNSSSELVSGAIAGFVNANFADMQFMLTRTGACINGAALATRAYIDGDLEMAANAQASASEAPDPVGSMPGAGRPGGNIPR